MKIIKRDGHMVDYCPEKIEKAIMKANREVEDEDQVSPTQIKNIIKYSYYWLIIFNIFCTIIVINVATKAHISHQ